MELNEFLKKKEEEQLEYLLELDIKERKDYIDEVKKKNKMLFIKLSGKLQSKMNINSKTKSENLISIHDIKPNPNQPRKTITEDEIRNRADSIKSRGLLQPIRIYFKDKVAYLIAGQIRLEAYKLLHKENPNDENYSKIKYELETNTSYNDFDLRIDALTENLSRKDMFILDTVFSIVAAFNEAKEIKNNPSYTTREFAKEYGIISASQLAKYLKIATLDDVVLNYVKEKNFNKANILYHIAKEDISNEKRINLIDQALQGSIKTSDLEKKKVLKNDKSEAFIFDKNIQLNIKGMKKQLILINKCKSKEELIKYTNEIKNLISKIEQEI